MPAVTALLVGFDSAWTDSAAKPGGIAAYRIEGGRPVSFHAPRLATFEEAISFIRDHADGVDLLLVAIDQPTIVVNRTGARPVDRIAASLISRLKGGVQPAYRDGRGAAMFGDGAPIWRFLATLDLTQDPESARRAGAGRFAIEVFPALALPAIVPALFERGRGAKYNPVVRRTFLLSDWVLACEGLAAFADGLGLRALADWARVQARNEGPTKGDQDRLDAGLCLAIACHWRIGKPDASMLLGDVGQGYIVTPVSPETRAVLEAALVRVSLQAPCALEIHRFCTASVEASVTDGIGQSGRVDQVALRELLIERARRNEPITYGEVAAQFGAAFHQGYVSSLTRALREVSRRNQAGGEPELMCLVVSKKDHRPGQGYFDAVGAGTSPDERRRAFDIERRKCHAFAWA